MANQTASIAIFYLSLYIMFTEFTKGKDSVKDYKIKLGLQQNCAICEEIMKSFFLLEDKSHITDRVILRSRSKNTRVTPCRRKCRIIKIVKRMNDKNMLSLILSDWFLPSFERYMLTLFQSGGRHITPLPPILAYPH